MFIDGLKPVPIIERTETGTDYIHVLPHNIQRYVYCYVYDCMYSHIPDLFILIHAITRSEYTVTYIDVDSLLELYRNRNKSASGF
jgi:hypothetical protein